MAHQIIDLNSNVIDMDDLVHQANQLFDAILSSKRAQDGVVAAYFS